MGVSVSNIALLLLPRLIRDSLSSVLTAIGFSVLHESNQQDDPVIVIVDFDYYNQPSILAVHQERGAKIVVLASQAECLRMSTAQIAPLSEVLTYDLSTDAFVRSLQLICSGERVFPCDLPLERELAALTNLCLREKEVLLDLVEGHSNKAIARHLGVTEATVKVHLKSVLRKINAENRTQATIWALANLPKIDANPGFA